MTASDKPRQQKPRRFNADAADILVGEIAAQMLAFMSARFATASEDERIELVVRYAPIMSELQKAIARAARAQQRRRQRRYPGDIETKHA